MDYIKIKFSTNFDQASQNPAKAIQNVFRPRPVNPMFSGREHTWVPQMDIFETPEEIVIWAEIAGVEKDDIDLEINSRAIKIAGIRRSISPGISNSKYRLAEIQYGHFERILYLQTPVDTEVVASTYADGLLKIRIAKLKLDTVHKIAISEE